MCVNYFMIYIINKAKPFKHDFFLPKHLVNTFVVKKITMFKSYDYD